MKPDYVSFKVEHGEHLEGIGKKFEILCFDNNTKTFSFMGFSGSKKDILELLDNAKSIVARLDKCYETTTKA